MFVKHFQNYYTAQLQKCLYWNKDKSSVSERKTHKRVKTHISLFHTIKNDDIYRKQPTAVGQMTWFPLCMTEKALVFVICFSLPLISQASFTVKSIDHQHAK